MNAEQSLALAISIVLCICLTLNSVILARDMSLSTAEDEPWQKGLGARLITMIIMWCVWLTITFQFIPWSDSAKEQVQRVTDGADMMLNHAERTVSAIVDEVSQ